jgi:hypothetical protein
MEFCRCNFEEFVDRKCTNLWISNFFGCEGVFQKMMKKQAFKDQKNEEAEKLMKRNSQIWELNSPSGPFGTKIPPIFQSTKKLKEIILSGS